MTFERPFQRSTGVVWRRDRARDRAGSVGRERRHACDDAPARPSHDILGMIDRADTVDAVAAELSDRIASVSQPCRIILFGSRARGTFHADSDYDFYIE